jgi:hypothetical protein
LRAKANGRETIYVLSYLFVVAINDLNIIVRIFVGTFYTPKSEVALRTTKEPLSLP